MKSLVIILFFTVLVLIGNSCKKLPEAPVVLTENVSEITQTTARSGGDVTGDGGAAVTSRGVCWATSQDPTISDLKTNDGNGTGSFVSDITGLNAGTTYYVRAYATNEAGTGYGDEKSFISEEISTPLLTTTEVTAVTQTGAVSGGEITDDGGGSITARGVCWSTDENPTTSDDKTEDGTGSGSFTSIITGLTPEITYYVRAYAINSAGTSYGSQEEFTTEAPTSGIDFNPDLTYGTVTDINGNVYKTIEIGSKNGGVPKIYLAENLRSYSFNDGTSIPIVSDDTEWSNLTTPGKCAFNNNFDYVGTYGFLYNWYAVNTGKLCPDGWHVTTDDEWTELTDYLGGLDVAGGKLKEKGTRHWVSPNTGATNESGFTALPGSFRWYNNGEFAPVMGGNGTYWTSTEKDAGKNTAWQRTMLYQYEELSRTGGDKGMAYSVRCVKDE